MAKSVAEVIEKKFAAKVKEKKGVFSGLVVLDIAGSGGGKWTLNFDEGTVEKKDTTNPTVRIKMADKDFIDMVSGHLNPAMAMFGGKLKVEGDMTLAGRLAMALR